MTRAASVSSGSCALKSIVYNGYKMDIRATSIVWISLVQCLRNSFGQQIRNTYTYGIFANLFHLNHTRTHTVCRPAIQLNPHFGCKLP